MFRDANGNDLTYWPITGLVEGATSEVITFFHDTPFVTNAVLKAADDPRANVWAREKGVGASYVNISTGELPLASIVGSGGQADFEGYVEALSPITGLERVPMPVFISQSGPAQWGV